MSLLLAYILLALFAGTTTYVFILKIIIPVYKMYRDEMQIK